ncbi:response regulator [Emticicia sp. BO119]|uniref:response regulator n=1 Tax=Emticicia sp. BO119 TaxID=2757768 RepID=UPI0015F01EE6|nr:response regulator [Emticicia sp. BO119]MBA4849303.1 response regulator [Emticicia sp. BO119]
MHVSLNVVLAEDDKDYQEIFNNALTEVNIPTMLTVVSDGVELMNILKSPDTPTYNIVVLDINMPKKDGIECLKEIRQDRNLSSTFSVILTSSFDPLIKANAFDAGANLFLTKPENFDEYVEAVRKILTSDWQMNLPIFF